MRSWHWAFLGIVFAQGVFPHTGTASCDEKGGVPCAGSEPVDGKEGSAQQVRAAKLTQAEFLRLHRQLRPAADEPWRTIPWKISLLSAQQTAAEQGKPIFIWAMDGHPLGCT